MLCTCNDVLNCSRPATTGISDSPVFEIPCGNSGCRERFANGPNILEVVFRAPESTVEHDRDGMWSVDSGKRKLSKLKRIGSVCDALDHLTPAFGKKLTEQRRALVFTNAGNHINTMVQARV